MLTRIYIDNYKTLQGFVWEPGRVAILLGRNGSGKSAVLEVLDSLRDLVCGKGTLTTCFPEHTRCRWNGGDVQIIEIKVAIAADMMLYQLAIEHPLKGESLVAYELLRTEKHALFEFKDGLLHLYDDKGTQRAEFPATPRQSGLQMVVANQSNVRLTAFKSWLSNLQLVRPNPAGMEGRAPEENDHLVSDLTNFASWYRHAALAQPSDLAAARHAFADIVPRFREMTMRVDEQRVGWLRALFDGPGGSTYTLRFEELSHGQRVLFALYAILHTASASPRLLILDEPDNFVALEEIQPFLLEILDRCLAGTGTQLFVASHHPEYLDQLAPDHGWVFDRPTGDATTIARFKADVALPPSALIARGELTASPTDETPP